MSSFDNWKIKKINKNYMELKLDKFPISGGILPDISLEDKRLNNNKLDSCWNVQLVIYKEYAL